ncbi:PH-like domain-containing protein [Streptacidiphilus rugosus]|uniref:PH-like domain-containing protein n=1 Tax=Streptacidiphilus rugosus TaxID=405783 RepID=UPI000691EEA0|nr:hypothetical protein [Streptacidiphilus rugosus]
MRLLAQTPHSAPVTHVGDLIGWTIGILLVIALVYWLMRQGWQWRRTVQSGLPVPAAAPSRTTEPILELEGRYAGTTTAGNWLDRVVAHRLGERSLVELTLSAEGLTVVRPASQSFFVPVEDLRGARLDKGIAGKVFPEGGLLVVTWELGGKQLDSGFRGDHASEHDNWVTAIEVLMRAHAKVTDPSQNDTNHPNVEGA